MATLWVSHLLSFEKTTSWWLSSDTFFAPLDGAQYPNVHLETITSNAQTNVLSRDLITVIFNVGNSKNRSQTTAVEW